MQERKKAINMKASKYRQVGLMSASRPLPWRRREGQKRKVKVLNKTWEEKGGTRQQVSERKEQ